MKDEIRKIVMQLDLGYAWAIADERVFDQKERDEIESEGLAEVEGIVDQLNTLMEEKFNDGYIAGKG